MSDLADKAAWISRVLHVQLGTAPPPSDALALESAADAKEELANILVADREYITADLLAKAKAIAPGLRNGDPEAIELFDEFAEEVDDAATADIRAEADQKAETDLAEAGAAVTRAANAALKLQALRSACGAAAINLATAANDLFATDRLQRDPRTADTSVQNALDHVGSLVPSIEPVIAAVAEVDARAGTERDKAAQAALVAIAKYRKSLDDTPALTAFEKTEVGAYPIFSLIDAALVGLEQELVVVH